jgi:hypothetical protein
MPLTCTCGNDYGDSDWYFQVDDDLSTLQTKRSRRCRSCNVKIKPGDVCLALTRTREPNSDIEERIYGDDWESVPMSTWYQCESCGEQYLNLHALGYCIQPDDHVPSLLKEYHELSGFKKSATG